MNDGTINDCEKKLGLPTIIFSSEKESSLTAIILELESKTIRPYQTILENHDDLSFETRRIFTEHIEKLNELKTAVQHQIARRLAASNQMINHIPT